MDDERIGFIALGVLGILLIVFLKCTGTDYEPPPVEEPISALVVPEDLNMEKLALGRRLYHDGILSGDGSVQCASCHNVAEGGAEPRRTSIGILGQIGPINSPTVLNSSLNFAQFWDGRADDLHEQAGGPVENSIEMGATFASVLERVEGDDWYTEAFARAYPDDGVTQSNIQDAIAEYERGLITPSPFDAFLGGDETAISAEAKAGYATFKEVGCTNCHTGVNIGGNDFQKMGLIANYFEARGGEITEADLGRFNVTGVESDRHKFKVPTLRNVALTAPYFHDGSQSDLANAVRIMGRVQLANELDDEQVSNIVAFLGSLTGELPEYATLPESDRPPERFYELPPSYDLRIASRQDENGTKTITLVGAVPTEELKTALIERFQGEGVIVDSEGLVVSADAGLANPDGFTDAFEKVYTALDPLSRGRADFDLTVTDGEPKLAFWGEGDALAIGAARVALEEVPGFTLGDVVFYDHNSAEVCDAALRGLQLDTKIGFRTGSAELDAPSRALVDRVKDLMAQCPSEIRLRIDGHTDNVGNAGSNLGLSRRRAASVRDRLINTGADPARLISIGFGQTKPIADNLTDEGRAQNRRIDLHMDRI